MMTDDIWPIMDEATVQERGRNLVARSDAWNFDRYLIKVILEGLSYFEDEIDKETMHKIRDPLTEYLDNTFGLWSADDWEKQEKARKKAFKLISDILPGAWS